MKSSSSMESAPESSMAAPAPSPAQ
jgi:hypothetical protein